MYCSDAHNCQEVSFVNGINVDSITIETLSEMQKDIDTHDLISLVFLLYDYSDTALERLIILQRIPDAGGKNLNFLHDWAINSHNRTTWKHELLEALAICQLFNVIKKLGFPVKQIKEHFQPGNYHINVNINPLKKLLYILCEHIKYADLTNFKNALSTHEINTTEYDYCEMILLELMCRKFIIVSKNNNISEEKISIENLANIIENVFAGCLELDTFPYKLREMERKLNGKTSFESNPKRNISYMSTDKREDANKNYAKNTVEIVKENGNVKSDQSKLFQGAYEIKNPEKVGVCYIINQEEFHLSKYNIEQKQPVRLLGKRLGSTQDQKALERTMSALKFEVISHRNLDHKQMLEQITNIAKYRVHHDHSVFMLCILSHGVRDHVFAADCVKVKVEDIQNLLDSEQLTHLYKIPKVLILQACQVNDDAPLFHLVPDAPSTGFHLKKSNFLIYWATAREYEAFRDKKKGSIFIQKLCGAIAKYSKYDHLNDIFTQVTDDVTGICTLIERVQVPLLESTLRKKLYLQIPRIE